MPAFPSLFSTVYRDYVTIGVPSSGKYKPSKPLIREWGAVVEKFIDGADGTSVTVRIRVVDAAGAAPPASYAAGQTFDGVVVAAGDFVMRAVLGGAAANGVYQIPATGAASRHASFAAFDSMAGCLYNVMEGDTYRDTLWRCTSNKGGTIDSTALTFEQVVTGGVLSNIRLAKTAAYTVLNADKGQTIALAGAAHYPLTFGAASGYAVDFSVMIVNEDATRGKCMSINGISDFIIGPKKTIIVVAQNNVWRVHGYSKWQVSTPDIYVDGALGSDNPAVADGCAAGAGAFATRQAAITALWQWIDAGGSYPQIHVADGTYAGTLSLTGMPPGAPVIFWYGATALGAVFTSAVIVGDGACNEFTNIKFSGGYQAHQWGVGDILSGCGIGGSGFACDGSGGTINISASISVFGTVNYVFHAPSLGMINISGGITITYVSTPVITAVFRAILGGTINMGGSIVHSGAVAAGCQKWVCGPAGAISFSGTSGSVPGSVAGAPALNAAPTGATGYVF